ncbi:MAG: SGNH/GDSL hydrolase family protein, partial [Ktedonobacterales bacterium]
DTYEWSDHNLENAPGMQNALRAANFTLVRTFIPDNADTATIEQRVGTIEHIGAHCLAVLTNIDNTAFNQRVVAYLGARCQLYEFGDEPDLANIPVAHYLARWNTVIPLLRRINPSAKFIGPVTSTPQGAGDYMQEFLEGVKASGVLPDAISYHDYPCYNDDESTCLGKADTYLAAALAVRAQVKSVLGRDLPVGVSEWNYDPGNPPPAYGDKTSFITQFTTRAIQAMIAAGVVFACQFDAASYSGYGRLDMFNVETGHAKPQFYAMAALIKQYRPIAGTSATNTINTPKGTSASASLLSRGATTICSSNDTGPGEPGALVDGKFGNWGFWELANNALPGWCALHITAHASNILVAWYSDYSFDYVDPTGLAPQDYDIAVSANSTNGSDGNWHTVLSVRGNAARAREHRLNFSGMSWVKMTILSAQPHASQPYVRIDELEVYNAQALSKNTFFFSGDSITAIAYNRFAEHLPSFADEMQSCATGRDPLTLDGGFGGQSSQAAAENITTWLALAPDVHYWLLGWGTNDALENVPPDTFRAHLQIAVTAIKQHGGVPVIAHIPYTKDTAPGLITEIQQLNQVIDAVTAANSLIAGPDFYALFKAHPEYLGPDDLHPSDAGAIAMNAAWFATLRSQLGLASATCK